MVGRGEVRNLRMGGEENVLYRKKDGEEEGDGETNKNCGMKLSASKSDYY